MRLYRIVSVGGVVLGFVKATSESAALACWAHDNGYAPGVVETFGDTATRVDPKVK